MAVAGVPEFLQPRVRLFMSVDLVGSTALKQSGEFPIRKIMEDSSLEKAGSIWIPDLVNFYRDFDAKFRAEWSTYCNDIAPANRWPAAECARLWKINGDELIYVREISKSREVVALLWCWQNAGIEFRKGLQSKNLKLDVKMTGWIAGFPVTNTEVIFETRASEEYADWEPLTLHYQLIERWYADPRPANLIQDFIGPTIDTGFRLATKATPRKFVVSLELAYILSITAPPAAMNIKIGYDGMVELKGVFGGRPYPVFWMDAHDSDRLSRAEDALKGSPHPQFGNIRTFCEEYIASNTTHMFKPFLVGDDEPLLCEIPKYYVDKLQHMASAWEKARNSRRAYVDALTSRAPPGEAETSSPEPLKQVTLPQVSEDVTKSPAQTT